MTHNHQTLASPRGADLEADISHAPAHRPLSAADWRRSRKLRRNRLASRGDRAKAAGGVSPKS